MGPQGDFPKAENKALLPKSDGRGVSLSQLGVAELSEQHGAHSTQLHLREAPAHGDADEATAPLGWRQGPR